LLLTAASNRGRACRILNCPPIAGLGQISYSLYVVHLICFDTILRLLGTNPHAAAADLTHPILVFASVFLVAFIAAALILALL